MSDFDLLILGAGVVGLTTALELKKEFRNAKIKIIADKFYINTTSYVAAGIFRPSAGNFAQSKEQTRKFITDSFNYWDDLCKTPHAATAGIKEISGYIYSSEHPHITRNKYLEGLVPIYRKATEDELTICPGNWKYGSFFSTILTDPSRYLQWALNKIRVTDIEFEQGRINSFSELPDFDVIINCTGLGAKILCNDSALVPLRGQVAKVDAPWIENFFYGDYDTYIIPSFDNVTLGGCRQYESYNLNVDKYDYLSMRERCEKLVPSLKNSKLIENRVGLRPHRIPVRVEKEFMKSRGKLLKIVHNYGHGGYGFTFAPGTALHTVKLVKEMLVGNHKY